MQWTYTYLEQHSVGRWNTLKHITSNILHTGTSSRGSLGDNLWEIQDGALEVRERRRDGGGGPAKAAGNIDEGGQTTEDVAALLEDDRHEEGVVRGHGVVEREHVGVALGSLPDRLAIARQGERGQTGRLLVLVLPEPRAYATAERGSPARVEKELHLHAQRRRQLALRRRRRRRRRALLSDDEEAGGCRQLVDRTFCAAATRRRRGRCCRWLLDGGEDARDGEHAHDPAQGTELTGVDPGLRDYLGKGGSATEAVDGVGDAEVLGDRERDGLKEAEGLVPEQELTLEQLLTAVLAEECHC